MESRQAAPTSSCALLCSSCAIIFSARPSMSFSTVSSMATSVSLVRFRSVRDSGSKLRFFITFSLRCISTSAKLRC